MRVLRHARQQGNLRSYDRAAHSVRGLRCVRRDLRWNDSAPKDLRLSGQPHALRCGCELHQRQSRDRSPLQRCRDLRPVHDDGVRLWLYGGRHRDMRHELPHWPGDVRGPVRRYSEQRVPLRQRVHGLSGLDTEMLVRCLCAVPRRRRLFILCHGSELQHLDRRLSVQSREHQQPHFERGL